MVNLAQLDTLAICTMVVKHWTPGYPHQTFPAVRPKSSGNWALQLSAQDRPSNWTLQLSAHENNYNVLHTRIIEHWALWLSTPDVPSREAETLGQLDTPAIRTRIPRALDTLVIRT